MRFGVLGTGSVGRAIGGKLVEVGHEVKMGSRSAGNENAVAWAAEAGDAASEGSFADAAAFGEVVVNATAGQRSLEALEAAGAENLAGKVLVDIGNAIDPNERPPALIIPGNDSLGEQIQRAFPEARVVKTLNTVNNSVMVDPRGLPGSHNVFVCGNDEEAKAEVAAMLESFGWAGEEIIDLGDISSARGTEQYVGLWVRLMGALGTAEFNIRITPND
jgi:8-hydroxy-5-deazaflavin:NADPH oxidoreductase